MPFTVVPTVARPLRSSRIFPEKKLAISPLDGYAHGVVCDRGWVLFLPTGAKERHTRSSFKHLTARCFSTRLFSLPEGLGAEQSGQRGEGHIAEETIAAIVTGGQQGSVSIIRLSGPASLHIAAQLFHPSQGNGLWEPESHRVYHGFIYDAESILDEVLLLVMLKPRSYTREDVVEIHTHGGGVSALRVLQACLAQGARQALAGEFTMRAFLNGRLTLAQAESVAELVNARTVAAADAAVAGLTGGLSSTVIRLRTTLLTLLANVEASIDFEEDVGNTLLDGFQEKVRTVLEDLDTALLTATRGHLLTKGLQVAFVGRPNVGKSSLLNALSGCERAIVTDVPGTTRDVVEAAVNMQGIPVNLMDTAGLRTTTDTVEYLGVQRARSVALAADIVVMVLDSQVGWLEDDLAIYRDLWESSTAGVNGPAILAFNKCDIAPYIPLVPADVAPAFKTVVFVSATTKEGLSSLQAAILAAAGLPEVAPGGLSWAINERQAEALQRAQQALRHVLNSVRSRLPLDCWTVDLRQGLLALGEVTGDTLTEEVLQAVFSTFCIGK
eukprot:jgi/Botrbrau1/2038/Bobra.0047s0018.3